jgi:hypothetical protein
MKPTLMVSLAPVLLLLRCPAAAVSAADGTRTAPAAPAAEKRMKSRLDSLDAIKVLVLEGSFPTKIIKKQSPNKIPALVK